MRVLVLGGTGLIGSAVVRELLARGHGVLGLARSDVSAAKLREFGATTIAGDIASPEPWAARLPPVDAVIHAACDFSSEMAAIDWRLLDVLLPSLAAQPEKPRFIYTGGCWLYGATGDDIATEQTPFRPLPAFAWMVPHLQRVLDAPEVEGVVIHPAMVYASGGGVFLRFARDALQRDAIRVVESAEVRWPLVHSEDLATLYALALEGAPPKSSYIGAAIDGLAVGRIARAFADRFGTRLREPQIVSADAIAAELGAWARGYALDQRLSGAKAQRDLGWRPKHLDRNVISRCRRAGDVHCVSITFKLDNHAAYEVTASKAAIKCCGSKGLLKNVPRTGMSCCAGFMFPEVMMSSTGGHRSRI